MQLRGFILARMIRPVLRVWSAAEAVGHYDFCPWANRYVHWLKQPIGWFAAGALASLLAALFVAPQSWLVFGALVAVMVLGVAWPWISMHGLSATLVFDRGRCRETESVSVRLTIRNRWPWPAWGLVVERGFFEPQGEADPTSAVTALARVPGWSQSDYAFLFRPERRGVYPRVPPVLATGFPFGIWSRTRPIPVEGELIVWPQTVSLTSVPAVGGDRRTVAGSYVDSAGDDGDILASRFYREGDPLRRVHWAQTARRDVLVVCERQTTARRRVVVALDGAAFAGSTRRDESRRDWAVRVCASLCRELHAHHCDVECRLNGQSLLLEPGPAGLRRLLDRLARYEPSDDTKIAGPAFRDQRDSPSTRDDGSEPNAHFFCPGASCTSPRDADGFGAGSLLIVVSRELRSVPRSSRGRSAARPRWVLIDDRRPGDAGSTGNTVATAAKPWIVLDATADVAGQLQAQWGKQCHDDWRIN
jgi:uncharacterized protein (DUF58 family)